MSERVVDSLEVKSMYSEIASLKKSIHEKQEKQKALARVRSFRVSKVEKNNKGSFRQAYSNLIYAADNFTEGPHNGTSSASSFEDASSRDSTSSPPQQYVTVQSKNGMALFNLKIYNQEHGRMRKLALARQNVFQDVMKQKEIEKIKSRLSKNKFKSSHCDRILLNGTKYAVGGSGRVLLPIISNPINAPVNVMWNKNLYKKLNSGTYKKVSNEVKKSKEACRYFTSTASKLKGSCQKGSRCKYDHAVEKIKICSQYLNGACVNSNCLLNHQPNDHNTPLCRYNLEGKCHNSQCKYSHNLPKHCKDPKYELWVCRPFSIGSWCSRGKNCPFLHVWNCPDYEEEQYCSKGDDCTLNHQFTKRIQNQISTKSNTYIREDEIVIEGENEEEFSTTERIVINSYSVSPDVLLVTDDMGRYQYFIDVQSTQEGIEPAPSTDYIIELSDSSDDEEELEDDG
ncbi:uncharacterized protein KGF55_002477 [Candida pseudojiufengensis]|uniref:uncharacterized protein n=1 Tax=Candida pseudojiufengensis TaxID=497109 RepID=UPI0022253F8B|nr:uncharacterized protein KGF55_002477 [Candida pseudojiufengensis]KAI5963597.1 hypothetical protein KGF55_002477 [Candida pseudojiufengensis]